MQRRRISLLVGLLLFCYLVVGARLVWLQGIQWEDWQQRSHSFRHNAVLSPAPRGTIHSRDGALLAFDRPVHSVVYTLEAVDPTSRVAARLARALRRWGRPVGFPCDEDTLGESLRKLRVYCSSSLAPGAQPIRHCWIQRLEPDLVRHLAEIFAKYPRGYPGLSAEVTESGGSVFVEPRVLFGTEAAIRSLAVLLGLPDKELLEGKNGVWEALAAAHALPSPDPAKSSEELARAAAKRARDRLQLERILVREAPFEVVRAIAYSPESFPGLQVKETFGREYPLGAALSHLVGFASPNRGEEPPEVVAERRRWSEEERSEAESNAERRRRFLREFDTEFDAARYRSLALDFILDTDWIGRQGVERQVDRRLRGRPGLRVFEVDKSGKPTPREPMLFVDPRPGESIRLTIDLALCDELRRQFAARSIRAGSAIVGDPTTGEIFASLSFPEFDPIAMRRSAEHYRRYAEDPAQPFRNRTRGMIHPGSIIKPLLALEALDRGRLDPARGYLCTGKFGPQHQKGLGCGNHLPGLTLDLKEALARSCNCYFYNLGGRVLGEDGMRAAFVRFSIGPERKDRLPFNAADAYVASIGQGSMVATPEQLYRFYSMLAMRGRCVEPHVVVESDPPIWDPEVQSEACEEVIHGMKRGPTIGTTSDASIGLRVFRCAVKTGTADFKHGDRDPINICWIAGFAPPEKPRIVFVIQVEHPTLHGGEAAGPVAAALLDYLQSVRGFDLLRPSS